MYVAYKNLPNHSRVWIYQADRSLHPEEENLISEKTIQFINQWTRHGQPLKGSFYLKYHQFLIIAVDESFNEVSGCSIDASVRFIKELEQELHIDFTNKLNISFKIDDQINTLKLSEFKEYTKKGKITEETIVFNNIVTTKHDFETKWEVPAKNSWHQKLFN